MDHDKSCAACGKSASLSCSSCRSASYCDSKCQKAHWKEHKSTCKQITTERTIYRAADTLQKLFYLVREKTFDEPIKKIESKGDSLIVHDKPRDLEPFIPFPKEMVSTEQEKQMVLSHQMCTDVQAYLYDTLLELLKGLDGTLEIEEWIVRVKTPSLRTRVQKANGELDPGYLAHHIILVGIKGPPRAYVFDISGAQFSIFEPCMLYQNYHAKYIDTEYEKVTGGTHKQLMKERALLEGIPGYLARKAWAAVEVFENVVQTWKKESGLSLADLLKLPEPNFVKTREDVLSLVALALDKFVATADFKKDQRVTTRYNKKHGLKASKAADALNEKIVKKAARDRFLKEIDFHRSMGLNLVVENTPDGIRAYEAQK